MRGSRGARSRGAGLGGLGGFGLRMAQGLGLGVSGFKGEG